MATLLVGCKYGLLGVDLTAGDHAVVRHYGRALTIDGVYHLLHLHVWAGEGWGPRVDFADPHGESLQVRETGEVPAADVCTEVFAEVARAVRQSIAENPRSVAYAELKRAQGLLRLEENCYRELVGALTRTRARRDELRARVDAARLTLTPPHS